MREGSPEIKSHNTWQYVRCCCEDLLDAHGYVGSSLGQYGYARQIYEKWVRK